MPHHVYANNNEIATKSSDGKSAACFHDVCFSPPTPPATGVPIPYANTCFAKDITNGSKTVMIGGAEVALENYSYFKSSVGDAPATHALKKGIRSGNVDGRGFFQTWSQNVKVEGKGVCRHMDLVTHNHTNSGNTVHHPFISKTVADKNCAKEIKRVKEKCKPESNKDDKNKLLQKAIGKNKYKSISKIFEDKGSKQPDANSWVSSHCSGLMIKPISTNDSSLNYETKKRVKDFQDQINSISKEIVSNKTKILEQIDVSDFMLDAGSDIAKRKVRNAALRHAAVSIAAAPTVVGEIPANILALIVDAADGIAGFVSLGFAAKDIYAAIATIKSSIDELGQISKDLAENPQRAMSNFMTVLAKINPCLRARRCFLVPYTDTVNPKALKGNGCCPGQTGHHVLPGDMFYGRPECPTEYKNGNSPLHQGAPTICTEGTSNDFSSGSHGKMHQVLDNDIKDYKTPGLLKFGDRSRISYEDAKDFALGNIKQVFPESLCSSKCFEKQLDAYYKDKIKCKTDLMAKSGSNTVGDKIAQRKQQAGKK